MLMECFCALPSTPDYPIDPIGQHGSPWPRDPGVCRSRHRKLRSTCEVQQFVDEIPYNTWMSEHIPITGTVTIDAVLVGTVQPFGPQGEPSAIRKSPVTGAVALSAAGLAGDQQAWHDHGGAEKALLHYAEEHYRMWRSLYHQFALEPGGFGENITTRGMTEESVCIGDRYRIRTAGIPDVVVEVSQPRQPCWKLGYNGGVRELPHAMQDRGATGWYYRVITPGAIAAGAVMELMERPLPEWTVERVIRGFYGTPEDTGFLEEMCALSFLSREFTQAAAKRLSTGTVEDWEGRLYGTVAW